MRYVPFDQKLAPNKWVYIGFFLVLAVLYGATMPPVNLTAPVTASDACYTAQTLVSRELKAPSTATFAPCRAPDSAITHSGSTWTVRSWVDAQNGFGAMIRTPYVATLRYDPNGKTWTLTGLLMD